MIIRKSVLLITAMCASALFSSWVAAGQLYRFKGDDGTTTLSTNLPPSAAQKGYDILDDRTMEVIKHVPRALTPEEISEQKRQQKLEAEKQKQAQLAAKAAEKKKQKQQELDRRLLASYPTVQDLQQARQEDIKYRQNQLADAIKKQPKLQKQLEHWQQQAAKQEINGHGVSKNLQKHIQAAQQEQKINNDAIQSLKQEIKSLNQKYDRDLARLRILLKKQNNP